MAIKCVIQGSDHGLFGHEWKRQHRTSWTIGIPLLVPSIHEAMGSTFPIFKSYLESFISIHEVELYNLREMGITSSDSRNLKFLNSLKSSHEVSHFMLLYSRKSVTPASGRDVRNWNFQKLPAGVLNQKGHFRKLMVSTRIEYMPFPGIWELYWWASS